MGNQENTQHGTADPYSWAKEGLTAAKADLDNKRKSYLSSLRKYYELRGVVGMVQNYGPKIAGALGAGGAGAWLENAGLLGPIKSLLGL